MKKPFINSLKILLISAILLFKLIDVIYAINYDAVAGFVEKSLGISETFYAGNYEVKYDIDSLNDFFDLYFFPIFLVTSFVLSLIGTFVLTRKRSLFSAVGLLLAFIIPKENIFHGSIRDKSTGNIIPFAVIRAFKTGTGGKKIYIGQTVADVDARYSLYLSEVAPDYKLEVEAPGYETFIQNIEGVGTGQQAFNVTQDINLGREEGKKGKKTVNYNKPKLYRILMWAVYMFSILYFVTFVYYVIAWPGEIYGWVTVIAFTYAVIRNTTVIKQRFFAPKGRLLDHFTKKPLKGVTVNFFKDGQKLETRSSDSHGLIVSSSSEGRYDVSIEKQGFKLVEPHPSEIKENLYFTKVNIDKEGYLQRDVLLENKGSQLSSKSNNPFS